MACARAHLVALLHLGLVLLPLVGEVLLQLLHGSTDLLLLGNHLQDHVVARLLLLRKRCATTTH